MQRGRRRTIGLRGGHHLDDDLYEDDDDGDLGNPWSARWPPS